MPGSAGKGRRAGAARGRAAQARQARRANRADFLGHARRGIRPRPGRAGVGGLGLRAWRAEVANRARVRRRRQAGRRAGGSSVAREARGQTGAALVRIVRAGSAEPGCSGGAGAIGAARARQALREAGKVCGRRVGPRRTGVAHSIGRACWAHVPGVADSWRGGAHAVAEAALSAGDAVSSRVRARDGQVCANGARDLGLGRLRAEVARSALGPGATSAGAGPCAAKVARWAGEAGGVAGRAARRVAKCADGARLHGSSHVGVEPEAHRDLRSCRGRGRGARRAEEARVAREASRGPARTPLPLAAQRLRVGRAVRPGSARLAHRLTGRGGEVARGASLARKIRGRARIARLAVGADPAAGRLVLPRGARREHPDAGTRAAARARRALGLVPSAEGARRACERGRRRGRVRAGKPGGADGARGVPGGRRRARLARDEQAQRDVGASEACGAQGALPSTRLRVRRRRVAGGDGLGSRARRPGGTERAVGSASLAKEAGGARSRGHNVCGGAGVACGTRQARCAAARGVGS
mmetsp:Transcript_3859/g.15955  ORF Transcript_3859/g.15955 Transcript_3859/m.15955 type:complete len:529 (-) Transcript_3859:3947-5533(-)